MNCFGWCGSAEGLCSCTLTPSARTAAASKQGDPAVVPKSVWCTALLAARLLVWSSLAGLGAWGQHRCPSGASLPVFPLLPTPTCSPTNHGGGRQEGCAERAGGGCPGRRRTRSAARCAEAVLPPLSSARRCSERNGPE